MHEWRLAGIALLLIGYAAVSGRLQSTVVTQAMVSAALGLPVIGNRRLPSRIRQGLNEEIGFGAVGGVVARERAEETTYLAEQTDLAQRSLLLGVTWTVALSVYAHGLTAWPGADRYAAWYAAHARDHPVMPESAPVAEPRLRVPAQPSGR